jgi:hypothetical protein
MDGPAYVPRSVTNLLRVVLGATQVQKLYMLLIPKETMRKEDLEHRKHRMLLLTRKKLPDVHSHARYWGFVEEVRSPG